MIETAAQFTETTAEMVDYFPRKDGAYHGKVSFDQGKTFSFWIDGYCVDEATHNHHMKNGTGLKGQNRSQMHYTCTN